MAKEDFKKIEADIVKQLISHEQLVEKAFVSRGLKLGQGDPYFYSNTIVTYELNGGFLEVLEKNGFKLKKRVSGIITNGVITLIDENWQENIPGYSPSNYWNFRNNDKEKDKLILRLKVQARINYRKRGVVLRPAAIGTFLSPTDFLPNKRIFEIAFQYNPTIHGVIHEIADGNGEIIIDWTNIGLGGIRHIAYLFDEFCGGKKELKELALSQRLSPFNPNLDSEKKYLPEQFQSMLFDLWEAQIKEFKAKI